MAYHMAASHRPFIIQFFSIWLPNRGQIFKLVITLYTRQRAVTIPLVTDQDGGGELHEAGLGFHNQYLYFSVQKVYKWIKCIKKGSQVAPGNPNPNFDQIHFHWFQSILYQILELT